MSQFGNKFGTFKGVFTPSILTILGVIMFLRLPWIVGQAGLWATLGIIFVAHIISATTGLSVSSIATDKKVETGGTYYMISRSLGLPIGGTLGLALFVGLSFSVSLYIIGFSETLLTALGMEVTLNTIRITGVITLMVVTIITFISTNLALKTQFIILAVLILSLISIFLGKHDLAPTTPLSGSAVNSLPWIALFAIFFPAVTGFEAGVSMSGDLENPKKSIPRGTILAILVGLIVYIGLAFFFSFTVERDALVNDSAVLLNISLYSPLVLAGIWGATLSSAFGSILGAPRILQATAIDRITPKVFAKGVGAGNEPRNAIILTFIIALAGILIGELNVIARVVSIFFIITYGFLNLTCAIENWAGSDFRPSFRIPAWISIIGALACFVVMIQLDFAAMIGATLILGAVFVFLKRKELKLQTGDTWGGFWSSLVKYGLFKLSSSTKNQRNWRPNIILFSGSPQARPHLIGIARILVGEQGVFTNFDLIEEQDNKVLFEKHESSTIEIDPKGKPVITRRHSCKDIYEGMEVIASVYGFTGFEPNTILMGWAKRSRNPEKFIATVQNLKKLDYNLVFLNQKENRSTKKGKNIDLWWNGNSRNLNFGIALLKYLTTDNEWRTANLRILITNYNSAKTDSVYALVNQILDNARLIGNVKVINNGTEKISEAEIIKNESALADLIILELSLLGEDDNKRSMFTTQITELPCSALVIEAGSSFDLINAHTIPEAKLDSLAEQVSPSAILQDKIIFPTKEILAVETKKIAIAHESFQNDLIDNSITYAESLLHSFHKEVASIVTKSFNTLEKFTKTENKNEQSLLASKILTDYTFQTKNKLSQLNELFLEKIYQQLNSSLKLFLESTQSNIDDLPETLIVKFFKEDYRIKKKDSASIKLFKSRNKVRGKLLGWPLNQKVVLTEASSLFLQQNRLESINDFFQEFGLSTFRFISNLRRCLVDLDKEIELIGVNPNKDEAYNKIEESRKQINDLLTQSIEEFKSLNRSGINTLYSDLEQNMQRLCFVVGKPESSYLLKPYNKIVKRRKITINDIHRIPEIWHNNLNLFANKCLFEFKILSLKHRLNIKLRKQVEEITRWTNGKLLETTKSIKSTLNELKTNPKLPDTNNLIDRISELGRSSMQEKFEQFYSDVNDILNDLPERIEVNSEEFFFEIENGKFTDSNIRVIEFRKLAQFYVGTELINSSRSSMELVTESLDQIASKLGDKLRLAAFNIDNLIQQSEGNEDANFSDLKERLINDLLRDIINEEQRINKLIEKFDKEINQFLINAILPLQQLVFKKDGDQKLSKSKRKKSRTFFLQFGNQLQRINSFFNNQLVRILYSKSEGIMLAQKFTSFEKEYKISNQSIQEMLVTLSGDKDTIKNIPFYYASLFSGSTTLSKDLWVVRSKEEAEALAITNRFKNGYSGALLITGDRNSGKSTLSKFIANTYFADCKVNILKPTKCGSISTDDFYSTLKRALNIETDPLAHLNSSIAKRVIIINDLELWWERTEDGQKVIVEIFRLIENLNSRIFFIVNCGTLAYKLINRILKIDTNFMGHIECEPFDAQDLKELVISRHKIGGLRLQLKGRNEQNLTEWNYAQLFNKYFNLSKGNPGYTLRTWLANITKATGKSIQIKLPSIPSSTHFNGVSDELWMVILQLLIHRRCNPVRLARVLRQSVDQTNTLLKEMQRAGLVEERFNDVYAINSYLEPHLVSKLKEKGFIND